MDGFISAFYQVDIDDDGVINENDLNRYCEENNLKKSFTEKWLHLFDHDHDKIIHYPEFCKVLGFEVKREFSNANQVLDDVEVYKETDISECTKFAIIKKIYQKGGHSKNLDRGTIEELKYQLNQDHGPSWDIIENPTPKEVGCSYAFDGKLYYKPNKKIDKNILVWKTRDYESDNNYF